jgi:hypothetical protein
MSYDVPYSDDQIGPSMISDFDQITLPGLYDTTRADIFKMVSSPCLSCDAPFKGMPQQMQYGPPFRPPCESSMSYDYNVLSQARAQYPESKTKCMSCGTAGQPSRTPSVTINPAINPIGNTNLEQKALELQNINKQLVYRLQNQQKQIDSLKMKENYQTFGPCACAARPYVSADAQGQGCSCLGLVGVRRIPEAPQSGVQPEAFCNLQSMPQNNMLLFMFLVIVIYILLTQNAISNTINTKLAQQPVSLASPNPT